MGERVVGSARGEHWRLRVEKGLACESLARVGRVYRVQVGSASQFLTADELRALRGEIDAALGDRPAAEQRAGQ